MCTNRPSLTAEAGKGNERAEGKRRDPLRVKYSIGYTRDVGNCGSFCSQWCQMGEASDFIPALSIPVVPKLGGTPPQGGVRWLQGGARPSSNIAILHRNSM